jgi:hypothetical protein
MVASLAFRVTMTVMMVTCCVMVMVVALAVGVAMIVPCMFRMDFNRVRLSPAPEDGDELRRQEPSAAMSA